MTGDLTSPNVSAMEVPDYTEVGARLGGMLGDDAMKWAQAFCQYQKRFEFEIDEGLMCGWFANAIEVSHDVRVKNKKVLRNPL